MKHVLKVVGCVSAITFGLTAFAQQSTGGGGAQSEACRAYARTAGGGVTGGAMTGGAMTGGAMTGGTNLQAGQVQNAIQSAVACLVELRADIETGQNAEEAALALLNIRQDLTRAFQAAQMVEESTEALAQLELLQQQVSEQRQEALASLDQATQSLSALSADGGAPDGTMTGGSQ